MVLTVKSSLIIFRRRQNLEQVKAMLDQAFTENHYTNTILHSDQGWQYQHQLLSSFLEDKGIQPSMSRKGNSQTTA